MIRVINEQARRVPTWVIYLLSFMHIGWLFWLGISGATGPEPIRVLEHSLGETALQLFIAVLAISPLRRFAGLNLLRFRRALGLSVFIYVTVHLAVWLFLDVQILSQIWTDILKRPYITIGMVAFVLMIPLAITSNNWSVRKLGAPFWARLHRLTYAAVLLGAVHNVMVQKVWFTEALVYLAVVVALLALRMVPKTRRRVQQA